MQRLIDALGHDRNTARWSRWGRSKSACGSGRACTATPFCRSPRVLPHCDLLITHGGNNTICEGFHFGLPMIALPLFWDQYDNAQRLAETGFGARLPTYEWTDDELVGTVERLLADDALRRAHEGTSRRGSRPGPAVSEAPISSNVWRSPARRCGADRRTRPGPTAGW